MGEEEDCFRCLFFYVSVISCGVTDFVTLDTIIFLVLE